MSQRQGRRRPTSFSPPPVSLCLRLCVFFERRRRRRRRRRERRQGGRGLFSSPLSFLSTSVSRSLSLLLLLCCWRFSHSLLSHTLTCTACAHRLLPVRGSQCSCVHRVCECEPEVRAGVVAASLPPAVLLLSLSNTRSPTFGRRVSVCVPRLSEEHLLLHLLVLPADPPAILQPVSQARPPAVNLSSNVKVRLIRRVPRVSCVPV